MKTPETLGRFGHHPDPAIDFCTEVDVLEGIEAEVDVGLASKDELVTRVERALGFVVGGDRHAIIAKAVLREISERARSR